MIPLTVTARLRSAVHLSEKNTAANFLAGLGYIPGRALLGAVAWAWLDAGGNADSGAFTQRFVSGAASWGDLHPVHVDPITDVAIEGMPTIVPRTVKTCKLLRLEHGHVDGLLPRHGPDQCSHSIGGVPCGAGLTRLEGALVHHEQRGWCEPKLHRRHRAHVSISFHTGTARPGDLFSREVLQEGEVFRGQIHCADEPTANALLDELPRLDLAVGGARSRGYGQVEVQVVRDTPLSLSVEDVKRGHEHIAARHDRSPPDARCFTLTAASPWSLRERDGGHARSLSSCWLARSLGVDEPSVRILNGDARSEIRSGWDGAAGLPTEVRHLIVAGSTFLCSVTGLDDDDLTARLSRLMERGLGGHRVEGLGRVLVNHPLHSDNGG